MILRNAVYNAILPQYNDGTQRLKRESQPPEEAPMKLSDPIPMGPGLIRSAIGAASLILIPFILSFTHLMLTGEV